MYNSKIYIGLLRMQMKILLLALFFLSVVSGVSALPDQSKACHGIKTIDAEIPEGFSFPWSVFTEDILMKTYCNTDSVQVEIGSGEENQYIWHEAYYTKGAGEEWESPLELEGNAIFDGKWIVGTASVELPVSYENRDTNYVAAYICDWREDEWKCGCRYADTCTSKGKWSLQTFTQTGVSEGENDDVAENIDSNKDFQVFDMTLYKDKPTDLTERGFPKINIVYGGDFFRQGTVENDLPPEEVVREIARNAYAKSSVVNIDIERWSLPEEVEKYMYVLDVIRDETPNLKVGFYIGPPKRDYWRAITGIADPKYQEWQQENNALQEFADTVDLLFPNAYTFYEDTNGWELYAKAQIDEAKRLNPNKPAYLTLWPEYHDSNATLVGQYVPVDFFRLQLETAKKYADGVVIWGGWGWDTGGRKPWSEDLPWWKEVQDFLKNDEEES